MIWWRCNCSNKDNIFNSSLLSIKRMKEHEKVKDLTDNHILNFYVRYVDDTLVVAKPSDINIISYKLNSYHPDLKFMHEEFIDNEE